MNYFFSGDERSRSAQQNFSIPVRSQENKITSSGQGDLFFSGEERSRTAHQNKFYIPERAQETKNTRSAQSGIFLPESAQDRNSALFAHSVYLPERAHENSTQRIHSRANSPGSIRSKSSQQHVKITPDCEHEFRF